MVLLFVVCGWREEAVAGVFLRTYLVHSTYVFLCTRATKVGKIVNPAVLHPTALVFLHVPPILIIKLLTYLCTLESHLGGKGLVFPSALTLA